MSFKISRKDAVRIFILSLILLLISGLCLYLDDQSVIKTKACTDTDGCSSETHLSHSSYTRNYLN